MLSDWLSIGYNIAVFGAWAVIICASMQERFSRRTTILLYVLASLLYFLLPQFVLPYGSLSRALVGMLSFTILQLFLYREKWYKTLFIVLVLIGVMMLSELLTVAFFTSAEALQTSVEMNSQPGFHIVNYLFCAVIHGLFLWLFALFLRRYRMRICPSEWLLYVAFPFSQCLLLLGWMDVSRANLDGSRLALMLAAVVICVVAGTAMFAAIRGMTQRSELRSKNALLETQIASQKEHYSSITPSIRRFVGFAMILPAIFTPWKSCCSKENIGRLRHTVKRSKRQPVTLPSWATVKILSWTPICFHAALKYSSRESK